MAISSKVSKSVSSSPAAFCPADVVDVFAAVAVGEETKVVAAAVFAAGVVLPVSSVDAAALLLARNASLKSLKIFYEL